MVTQGPDHHVAGNIIYAGLRSFIIFVVSLRDAHTALIIPNWGPAPLLTV